MSDPGSKRVTFADGEITGITDQSNNRFGAVTPIQVVEAATNDIRDSVRRNLETIYANSPDLQRQIERLGSNERRASSDRVSVRREYSPVVADNSIMHNTNAQQNRTNSVPPVAVDREIERLREHVTNNDVHNAGDPPTDAHFPTVMINTMTTLSNLIRDLQRDVRNIQQEMRMTQGQTQEGENRPRYTNELQEDDVPYGRTECDIRHRRSSANINFLPLKEARL